MENIYIKSLPVNLFDGVFNTTINFVNGLNIISGVNGTGKTQVLQQLKNNVGIVSVEGKSSKDLAIFAVSPKRNTEKHTIESIFQQVTTQSKTIQTFIDGIKNFQMKDSGFESYPSFAELFIQEYNLLMQDGKTAYDPAINATVKEFNNILYQVFPDYQIEASWIPGATDSSGKLDLKIRKYSANSITIDKLSTGEREVFALLFCIFVSRDKEDVYLIDEPEIHLNWDLESGLFHFLNWFCENFHKQVIVVTHSRIIFSSEFYVKTQFFIWENNKIICKKEVTEQQKSSIAGEISNIVNMIGFGKPTFFVEDENHKVFVSCLAKVLSKEVVIIVCHNKQNVKTMFNLLEKSLSTTNNVYFLVDGDNENLSINSNHFVSLKKYCIENYLFDSYILSKTFEVTQEAIEVAIVDCLKDLKNPALLVYKKLADSVSPFPFEVLDTFDGSKIASKLVEKFSRNMRGTIERYIKIAQTEDKLKTIFGEIIAKLS